MFWLPRPPTHDYSTISFGFMSSSVTCRCITVDFDNAFLYLALLLLAVEAVFVAVDNEGARLGDRWAGTRVTEARA